MIPLNIRNDGGLASDEIVRIYLSIHSNNASLTNVSRVQLVNFERSSDVSPGEVVAYQAVIKPEQMAVHTQQ